MNDGAHKRLTVIFPMAGQGARFGYRFKPFLEIDGTPFIAAAVEPFLSQSDWIDSFMFIYLDEQDRAHNVELRLTALMPDIVQRSVKLGEATPGPSVTLRQALARSGVTGPIIVCDCDHALDVAPIFAAAADPEIACILPTWSLDGESLASWSVAGIASDGVVHDIAEKAMPSQGERFRGVIGCYYFQDAAEVADIIDDGGGMIYISDIIRALMARGRKTVAVDITNARFFGDPDRLAAASAAS